MRIWTLTILFTFGIATHCSSQNFFEPISPIEISQLQKHDNDPLYLYLPMDFNQAEAKAVINRINVSKIESISLVYTKYRLSPTFDQIKLNLDRTAELLSQIPRLKKNKDINWYWVSQTGCNSPKPCYDFFHGFEIKLKDPKQVKEAKDEEKLTDAYTEYYFTGNPAKLLTIDSLETETSEYDVTTSDEYLDSMSKVPGSSIIKICDTVELETSRYTNKVGHLKATKPNSKQDFISLISKELRINQDLVVVVYNKRKILSVEGIDPEDKAKFIRVLRRYYFTSPSLYNGKILNTKVTMIFKRTGNGKAKNFSFSSSAIDEDFEPLEYPGSTIGYTDIEECKYIDTLKPVIATPTYSSKKVHDNVVTKVFNRNKDWENCLIATDVTGSMSPYLGQFLAWHRKHIATSKNKDYIFFNDGDNMADYFKITGRVGGTYYVNTDKYGTLLKTLKKAQRKGGGGDRPENNIEAILSGIKASQYVSGVILIADNKATPRDLGMLSKVKKPIHVILCGSRNGINVAYLNLVRENGGTLHTMEQDYVSIAELQDGEGIEIGGVLYRIEGDEFVLPKKGIFSKQ